MHNYRVFWQSLFKSDWVENSSVIKARDNKRARIRAKQLINAKNKNTAAPERFELVEIRRIIRKAVKEKSVWIHL